MSSKTILELYREKVFQSNDLNHVDIPDEFDNETKLRRLEEICYQSRANTPYLLNTRGRKLLKFIKSIADVSIINQWLNNDGLQLPPLELLCFLHSSGVMQITTFLYFKPEFCADISGQLVEMITTEYTVEDKDIVVNIVKLVMSSMINVGNQSLRELYTLSSTLMESFTTSLIDALFSSNKDLTVEFLSIIVNDKCVFQDGMRSFATLLFNSLLTYDSTSVSLKSAITDHHKKWTSQFIPDKFKSLYNQLETFLTKEGVMMEVELILDDGKVNLKHLLYVVALMTENSQQPAGVDIVKASADKWFKEALSVRNEQRLGLVLLIIRHYFSQISKYLVNYAQWFGSVQAKNVLTFNFFFEFLSKLVPYESAVFLKIQVTKVPSGPSSCQDVISDYISLAKTRLVDMNQTYDFISLFNDFHETIEDQQESDVNRVLSYYSECGEVTKAVLEASVFRKQYYEKVFLPCLLSVPRGTDQSRDQLIIKLNTMGKMPSSMYRNWSKSR